MRDYDIHIGIKASSSEFVVTKDGRHDAQEMRRIIFHSSRDSALIRRILDVARIDGLSGEDTYVFLAYTSLVELERVYRNAMRAAELSIKPGVIE